MLGDMAHFKPKLIVSVGDGDSMPLDASLAPETRAFLRDFVTQLGLSNPTGQSEELQEVSSIQGLHGSTACDGCTEDSQAAACVGLKDPEERRSSTTIEVPLTSDSTFFRLLVLDMSSLDALQSREVGELNSVIIDLGQGISHVVDPSKYNRKTDMSAWREIFKLYTESDIFFSTNEQSHSSHNSVAAQAHMQAFLTKLGILNLAKQLKRADSRRLLNEFVGLNMTLLRNLKFQELNTTATMKILKSWPTFHLWLFWLCSHGNTEFDKRTALGARQTFPNFVAAESTISITLAKRVCFQISEELVAIIPQLDDYLCPVCFNVSWKPLRLKCQHVFCVRCMLVMQRANNGHCPLCRENVIMEADSSKPSLHLRGRSWSLILVITANIDPALMNLLIRYFPAEVKAKQRENEHAAALDIFGKDTSTCLVM